MLARRGLGFEPLKIEEPPLRQRRAGCQEMGVIRVVNRAPAVAGDRVRRDYGRQVRRVLN
jgi:hypothetical protein